MFERPFRFLHAADLHLDRPAAGVADATQALVDLLVDGPRQAAQRVFDAALEHRVDFVVLAGDVIDPAHSAPRDWLFLLEQFQRLARRNIVVYWCGGSVDSLQQWPDYISWPPNVRWFPAGRSERYRHEIAGQAVCEIVGRGHDHGGPLRAYDFTPSDENLFAVAIAHADWNSGGLGEIGIDYWALGGAHQRSTPLDSPGCVAHDAGSPQGRCAEEIGPHGCTLVGVDEMRRIRLTPLTCDVLRWQTPRLSWTDSTYLGSADREQLQRLLLERSEQLLAEAPGVTHLATWKIACHGARLAALRQGALGSELAALLRRRFGDPLPGCWAVHVEADRPDQLPAAWHEEESVRGDFLRAVRQYVSADAGADGQTTDQLLAHLPTLAELTAELTQHGDFAPGAVQAESMRGVWEEAAWLGAELLSPQEAER